MENPFKQSAVCRGRSLPCCMMEILSPKIADLQLVLPFWQKPASLEFMQPYSHRTEETECSSSHAQTAPKNFYIYYLYRMVAVLLEQWNEPAAT